MGDFPKINQQDYGARLNGFVGLDFAAMCFYNTQGQSESGFLTGKFGSKKS
jgi:hypothetical protein